MARETVITNHTRPFAKELLTPGILHDDKVILVRDGTSVYVHKNIKPSPLVLSVHCIKDQKVL